MPLPDLDILVAVVDAGSISAAADRLGTPRATVSRWLTKLEDHVGARLVHRTTRQLVLTEAGTDLYQHARSIVDAVEAATAEVRARDAVPRGLLRITKPPGGDGDFGAMIAGFLLANPSVRIEVIASTRYIDLVAEGYDLAIRAGTSTHSSLVSRTLTRVRSQAFAHPDYLRRAGTPTQVEDLANHDCLVSFERGEIPQRHWPLIDGGSVPIPSPRMACNDLRTLSQAACAGLGIAVLPRSIASNEVAEGLLTPVLTDHVGREASLALVFPERRLMLPRVRAFIDHATEWVTRHPLLGVGGSP